MGIIIATKEEHQNIMEAIYLESHVDYSNLTDENKQKIRIIMRDSYRNKEMPNQTLNKIREAIPNISREQANTINITERSKASNLSQYIDAKYNMTAKSFTVHVNSDACELCKQRYVNKIFDIDEVDKLPPCHDKCGCTALFSQRPSDGSSPYD